MGFSDLPCASGKTHQKVFEKLGWVVRTDGSHIVMKHAAHPGILLSIPAHAEVRKGTLKSIIAVAGITDKFYKSIYESL